MRKLMWFTIGFAIAIALCAYLIGDMASVYIALVCGLCCVGFMMVKRPACSVVAVIFLGCAVGMLYFWGYDAAVLSAAKSYDGKKAFVELEATDYSFRTDYGTGVDCILKLDGRSYKARLYMDRNSDVFPGDVLSGRVRLRYTPEGGLQISTYHKGEGIFLLAYGEDTLRHTKAQQLPKKYFAAEIRKNTASIIDLIFPEDTAFFAKALLLGDDSSVSFSDNIALQKSGIRHVVAVSGLHVSFLFSLVYFATGRRKLLTLLVGIPVLAVFASVAGFTPSVVRACIMQGLIILAVAAEREYDPATALSFAVFIMLLVNPLTVTSASFQLSVGCMIGIFAFAQPIRDYLYSKKWFHYSKKKSIRENLLQWFTGSVSVSVSALIVTVPLCAWYFGTVSLIGIVTNLLTLWIVSYIFCGIILACVLSFVWSWGAGVLAVMIAWPIRYVLFVARNLSEVPMAILYTNNIYGIIWIIFSYGLLAIFCFSKKKRPVILIGAVTVMYALTLGLSYIEPYFDNVQLTVLDVGQGQCILLQSKGDTYLIDCGGEDPKQTATTVLDALGTRGITRLDGLILTHYDLDHAGATNYVLETVEVEKLYLPDADPENTLRRQLEKSLVPVCWVQSEQRFSCGTGELVLYPAQSNTEGNESSMCILFRRENCDILITGDRDWSGEQQLLRQGNIPDIEILVAGHHGAATSTGIELLNATKPELVLISVGAKNLHGHPDEGTLARLYRMGCTVRRTDLEGTIVIRG